MRILSFTVVIIIIFNGVAYDKHLLTFITRLHYQVVVLIHYIQLDRLGALPRVQHLRDTPLEVERVALSLSH